MCLISRVTIRCYSSFCCPSPGTRDVICPHGHHHLCVSSPTYVGRPDTGLCCERDWKAGQGNLEAACRGCRLPLNLCRDTTGPGLLESTHCLNPGPAALRPEGSGDAWARRAMSSLQISKHGSLGPQFQAAAVNMPLIWFLLQVFAFVKGHLSLAHRCWGGVGEGLCSLD